MERTNETSGVAEVSSAPNVGPGHALVLVQSGVSLDVGAVDAVPVVVVGQTETTTLPAVVAVFGRPDT